MLCGRRFRNVDGGVGEVLKGSRKVDGLKMEHGRRCVERYGWRNGVSRAKESEARRVESGKWKVESGKSTLDTYGVNDLDTMNPNFRSREKEKSEC